MLEGGQSEESWGIHVEIQKWKIPLRNFRVGDIVILKEDTQRNDWRLAKVIKV